jgi:putative transposase
MPRRRRVAPFGELFHVTNRGVERRELFREAADYRAFLWLLERARHRYPVSLFGLCLMPNHFHLVVRPEAHRALSAYLHWVQGCHARNIRVHSFTLGYGHVFQQRFWSGGIADDYHLLNVLRYVEANPVSGNLVARAEDWPWSSLSLRRSRPSRLLDPLPIRLPEDWSDRVNEESLPGDAD